MTTKKVPVNITIDEDLNEWLEKMATELRMNKSQFINNIISASKDDVKILKAIGLFNLGKVAMRVEEKAPNIRSKGVRIKG
jgi:hypothetical protein